MHGSWDNWATSEKTRRPGAGVRAPYLSLQGDQPHRRGLHAPLWPRLAPRARCAAPAFGDARRAARLPSPAAGVERLGRALQPDGRRVGRRASAPGRARTDVRLLSQRVDPAAPAARRPARGPVRRLWRSARAPLRRAIVAGGIAQLREAAAPRAGPCAASGSPGAERRADRPLFLLRLRTPPCSRWP